MHIAYNDMVTWSETNSILTALWSEYWAFRRVGKLHQAESLKKMILEHTAMAKDAQASS